MSYIDFTYLKIKLKLTQYKIIYNYSTYYLFIFSIIMILNRILKLIFNQIKSTCLSNTQKQKNNF